MRTMARLLRLLSLLGVNAVPAAGVFLSGWSSATALVLYWWENFFGSLLIAARIVVHRRVTRKRGHYGGARTAAPRASFLAGFLSEMLLFTTAHGMFLAVILFFLSQQQGAAAGVNRTELEEGLVGMTGFLLAGLSIDLVGLRERPFAWLKHIADVALGRMLVVHLTIIFGGAAYAYFEQPRTFFGVFIGLKVLLDLAWWSAGQEKPVPDEAPRWTRWFARPGQEEEIVKAWQLARRRQNEVDNEFELPLDDAPVVEGK